MQINVQILVFVDLEAWTLNLWVLQVVGALMGHGSTVCCIGISADGVVATGSRDSMVIIWDAETQEARHHLPHEVDASWLTITYRVLCFSNCLPLWLSCVLGHCDLSSLVGSDKVRGYRVRGWPHQNMGLCIRSSSCHLRRRAWWQSACISCVVWPHHNC